MDSSILAGVGRTDFNPKHAVSWLETQPEELKLWKVIFDELLLCAEKPRQSSGNACVKLYGFVEQCSKSAKPSLRQCAFAESTALRLFKFFMEWNEQDSHRSMRLVLDFLTHFITNNPTPGVGDSVKATILNATISTITQQSSRPSVKSAMVALDHFIQKRLVFLCDALETYRKIHGLPSEENVLWDTFVAKIFAWMELHYVCAIAGKLLVTIFTTSWYEDKDVKHQPDIWHEFIYKGLRMNIDYLEPIKHYIFVPLFKTDRTGSLAYLHHLSLLQRLTSKDSNGWDLNSMLWLAMLEAGKKVGVIGEPGSEPEQGTESATQLRADVLERVLCHESHEARSSAVSILVASPSTTKPYTGEALELLKLHLPSFHEDPDPKMRYDVLGHSRNMIKRIQNIIESLQREEERLLKKVSKSGVSKAAAEPTMRVSKTGQTEKRQKDILAALQDTLRQHEDFVRWYVGFLKSELAPTASYQRHITALKAMEFITKPARSQGTNTPESSGLRNLLIDTTWFRSILDLIMDPFDDVRETAASLIMSLSLENGDARLQGQMEKLRRTPIEELQNFCAKADELSRRTARADHSDGAARSFELLCRLSTSLEERMRIPFEVLSSLEAKLTAAERDLANAVLEAPMHGSFASLRYIWGSISGVKFSETDLKTLEELQDRAITCCQRIWQTVRHVLCDDSPEGHLPEELEEVEGLDTKDLLSYSFRAIHESSNFLQAIASNARYNGRNGLLAPSRQNFEAIGRLTFDELSNLRHRGAFTTVSQTFTSCCSLVKFFLGDLDAGPNLLDEWYQGALNCIHTQASTTRRSAGIPALIVGILSSNADRPSFEDVIHNLQEIGCRPALVSETDGSNLPQVHALNCIKDIFKSSYLSSKAEPYLTDCLQLAANSLKSEIWAIRNCGLLLLRSLIDCLFGTSESKTSIEAGWDGRTVKIPYHKFKTLPALLVSLLEMGQQSSGVLIGTQTAESVFPALDIIRRAGPPEQFRDKLYDVISWYLGSRIWHVREIAARTLCSFLLKPGWLGHVAGLLTSSGTSANKLHGALLAFKFLLERLIEVMPDQLSDSEIHATCLLLTELPSTNHNITTCPEVRAIYIEIVSFVTRLDQTENKPATNPPWDTLQSRVVNLFDQSTKDTTPSALLDIRLGKAAIKHVLLRAQTREGVLEQILTTALKNDVNVASHLLDYISSIELRSHEERARRVQIYATVILTINDEDSRATALNNISDVLHDLLCDESREGLKHLPSEGEITELRKDLQEKPLSPSLADAIVRFSGSELAILFARAEGVMGDDLEQLLRRWGFMLSDAGMDDMTFDSRIAAVGALSTFIASIAITTTIASDNSPSPAHLPWLLALYDALNDDDDEVRAAAASAAAPLLSGQRLVAVEAIRRLLRWLVAAYGNNNEFRAHIACRMTGNTPSPPTPSFFPTRDQNDATTTITNPITKLLQGWTSAEEQLEKAMRFDDSLFAVEEQNLYVDELTEARRWRRVFSSLSPAFTSPSTPLEVVAALSEWTHAGLQTLIRLAGANVEGEERRDGPLGWTSKPEVFAICARVVTCGAALAEAGDEEIGRMLIQFRDVGRETEVHGLLLGLCDEEVLDP
ncbi:putative death-receptor fusion protein-domain-containing protein [Hypomontagnella monticulosa]|nr:putative death-receptor fusion protein-domain-containing protein [Hypomontagnella monticulosa]